MWVNLVWESVTANSMDILEQIRTILSMNSVYDMVVSFLRLGEVESQTEMATYVLFHLLTVVTYSRLSPTNGCHLLMDHIVKYYHTVHVVFNLLTIW